MAYRFKIRKNTNFTNLEKFVKTREIRFCTSLLSTEHQNGRMAVSKRLTDTAGRTSHVDWSRVLSNVVT